MNYYRNWKKKSKTPAQISAVEKSEKLLKWFEGIELPESLKLNKWTEINDLKRFLDTHRKGLENTEPLSLDWKNYYMRLYEAKQKLTENENNRA